MKNRLTFIFFLSFLMAGCSSDPLDVDVSEVEIDLKFSRFEERMFGVQSKTEMADLNKELITEGGELYEFYVYDMLRSGSVYDDSISTYLMYFVEDSMMQIVYTDIHRAFGDFQTEEERLIDVFKHMKYHLPKAPLPERIITYNSAFNYGVVSTDKRIGIGLDMYLGNSNPIVQKLGFPQYMKEKMEAEYLPVDVAHSWMITNVMGEERGDTFLSSMIYFGKLRYVLDAMMPDLPDHLKIRYTEEEYDWSLASEYNIWQFLMDMNWIYTTDAKVKLRFFEEAPETVGIDGSPGRIGQFMGWQMVRQYMEKNPEVTVEELLNEKNEARILKEYKPKELD